MTALPRQLTGLLFILLAGLHAAAQTPAPASTLDARVKAEIANFKGQVSLFAKNLDTDASYGLNADDRVRTASTIKLPIMIAAFAHVAEGKAKWSDELLLTDAKKVSGSGVLGEFGAGLKLTLRDAVNLMIVVSDNTATNLVLDALTADAVNARMEALGLKHTRSLRKIGGGGESKAFSDASNKRADGSTYGIGVSTPREMVTLLEKLERGEIVSPEASKEMLAILKRQQYHDGLARNLKGVELANKTGALDALRSDVGVIYSPRGRIAIALTCDGMPEINWSVDNPALLLLSRLSEILVDGLGKPQQQAAPSPGATEQAEISAKEFEIIEGVFHDGLGTYAELLLANNLLKLAQLNQPPFATARAEAKMTTALARLPTEQRTQLEKELNYIRAAAERGAGELLKQAPAKLKQVKHTARAFADAKAGDVRLEFADGSAWPISVKTDKSGKVAVAEGQTPDIAGKWAERYFNVSRDELDEMVRELGFASLGELKANYRNVAHLVAKVLILKLGLEDYTLTDFRHARITNLDAVKHLLRQLRHFKRGHDQSRVIIFDRADGEVKWETRLDAVEIEALTAERLSLLPARPRNGHAIASEFGLKVDGRTIVTFQIKHRRGKARGTTRQYEFSDITTRLSL